MENIENENKCLCSLITLISVSLIYKKKLANVKEDQKVLPFVRYTFCIIKAYQNASGTRLLRVK